MVNRTMRRPKGYQDHIRTARRLKKESGVSGVTISTRSSTTRFPSDQSAPTGELDGR